MRGCVAVGLALAGLVTTFPVPFSAEAGVFQTTGAMHTARYSHTATLLPNGEVLVTGGYDSNDVEIASAELYEPASGLWQLTSPMIKTRAFHTATLLPNGRVLVAGGYTDTGSTTSAEIYDPATGMWRLTGPMHQIHSEHSATLLPDGKVLVASGDDESAELYNPATGNWTETGSLTDWRYGHTATLLGNGKVLVAAGGTYTAEFYDPATGVWTWTDEPWDDRDYHTATLLPDGRALLIGGLACCGPFGGPYANSSMEWYDPTDGGWTRSITNLVDSPVSGRAEHTATLLFNGRVLTAGGEVNMPGGFGTTITAGAKEYDPVIGEWGPTVPMTMPRYFHTATLLNNGQVLIAGGTTLQSFYVATQAAELYTPSSSSSPTPTPPTIADTKRLPNGEVHFSFTNTPGARFSVLATTHPTLPLNDWMVLGGVVEVSPGQFQFTDTQATSYANRYYRLRSQ